MEPARANRGTRYAILGPLALYEGERVQAVGGPRQVALLALLLVHANRAVSNDRLIDALWRDRDPVGAVKCLRVAVTRLRRTLDGADPGSESPLRTVSGGYLLAVGPGELDADVFEAGVRDGRRALDDAKARSARDILGAALALWRGPALAEVAFEEFAGPEIRRLEERRLAALEARVDADLRLGAHAELVGELDALLAAHPGREGFAAQLMLALYRCGRQGDALEAYSRTRAYLSTELGIEPGAALKALQQDVLEQSDELGLPRRGPAGAAPRAPRVLARALAPVAGQLPFAGREHELASLTRNWDAVGAGERRVVVISGEAGIGKTRIAAELAARVHAEGSLVLYGRCDEGLAAPYQPFVEVLRRLMPVLGVDRLRSRLGGLAPELGRLLPELDPGVPASRDAESARLALFEAVAAVFEIVADEPTLLIVDDAHWAAPATLLLLRHLVRCERRPAMLVIVTYRSTELQPGTPPAALMADLQRDDSTERIALGGLDEQSIDTLVRAASLAAPAPRLAASVRAATAGNPFFVRELLAHLVESQAGATPGGAAAPLPATLDIPGGLRGVVCHRVARLSDPAVKLMTLASAAAGPVDLRMLEPALPSRDDLLDALDEAVAAGLLVECGRGAVDFAHALVRNAVYDSLGTARRLHLHRLLGDALERYGDPREHVEALAYHFAQLAQHGEIDKATGYAVAAGRAATGRLAYEDAVAHFERGLDALAQARDPDPRRRMELLLSLGQARWSTGEPERARDAFTQAGVLADALGDVAGAVEAALGFSGPPFFEIGVTLTPSTEAMLQRTLAMLDGRDGAVRARLMGRLAAARTYAGGRHDHHALAYDALAMARRSHDRHALAEVLATCCWATLGPDDRDRHLGMARELTRLAVEAGDVRLLAYGRQWVLGHLLERGELDGVLAELDDLDQFAAASKDRFARWLLAVIRAMLAAVQGQLSASESLAGEAIGQWGDRVPFPPAARVFAAQTMALRREQGRLAEVVERIAAAAEQTPEVPAWRCTLAHVYAQLGEADSARDQLRMLGDLADLPRDALWLLSMTRLATVAHALDDRGRSQEAYDLLLPYANRFVVSLSVLCEGSTSRPLGMLATTLGRYDDAALHFDRALDMCAQIRSPPWMAHTACEYARMLRLRGGPGDHARAGAHLATADATAGRLGLHALKRRVADELRCAAAA